MSAVENVESKRYCECEEHYFGPNCLQNETQFEDEFDENSCKHGVFDARNTITGCSCRESIGGSATQYHGWYCERHNRLEILEKNLFL